MYIRRPLATARGARERRYEESSSRVWLCGCARSGSGDGGSWGEVSGTVGSMQLLDDLSGNGANASQLFFKSPGVCQSALFMILR